MAVINHSFEACQVPTECKFLDGAILPKKFAFNQTLIMCSETAYLVLGPFLAQGTYSPIQTVFTLKIFS